MEPTSGDRAGDLPFLADAHVDQVALEADDKVAINGVAAIDDILAQVRQAK